MTAKNTTSKANNTASKAVIQMGISIFKIPPCHDILVVGKKAPIGMNAAIKMLQAIAPDQFEMIEVKNPIIDGMVVKKELIKLMGKDQLTQVVIEEIVPLMESNGLIQVCIDLELTKTRTIEVPSDSSE